MRKGAKIFITIILILIVILVLRSLLINQSHGNGFSNNNIEYGQASKQKFDFYPSTIPSDTLIIVVHGGAWIAGDKEYMSQSAKFFASKGYEVINMNYRLAPSWKYDAPLQDIALVIKKINSNPERYNLKPNYKIVLVGHSAGAHLATLYGLEETQYGTQEISEVVGLAGPYDLTQINFGQQITRALDSFRGDYSLDEISPTTHITYEDQTKFLLINGGQDALVPVEQVSIFKEKLENKNVYVETLIVPERDHNTILSFIPSNDLVAQKIVGFIE